MGAVTGLTVIKKFPYRGNADEEWSNTYWLGGTPPANDADWRTLFDALVAEEKTVYPSWVHVIGGYAYDDDTPGATAVWSVDLTVSPNTPVAGTLSASDGTSSPGDAAVWVRWGTERFNSKGKRIYLRKYFHAAYYKTASGPDEISADQKAALVALGAKLSDGSFAGGRHIRSRGSGETINSYGASSYVTTRTLKRRGKRP